MKLTRITIWLLNLTVAGLTIGAIIHVPYAAFYGKSYLEIIFAFAAWGIPMTLVANWRDRLKQSLPLETAEAKALKKKLQKKKAKPEAETMPAPVRKRVRKQRRPPTVAVVGSSRGGDTNAQQITPYLTPGLRDLVQQGDDVIRNERD